MRVIFHRKSRWAWVVCLLLLAGFVSNSISNYLIERADVRKTIAESTLPLSSDNVYSEIQRDLLSPVLISSMMARNTFLHDWVNEGETDQAKIVDFLGAIKTRYRTVTSFFVSEKTRHYYYAEGLLKTVREDEPRDDWYFRVRDMRTPYEINLDPDLANRDEATIFINYRVIDEKGQFLGATGVGLTVNWVNQLISRYETKYARQIYFVDADGNIVLRPSNSQMKRYQRLDEIDGLGPQVSRLLEGEKPTIIYERNGEERIMNCRYVPELKWFLIVEQSEEMMLAPLRAKLRFNILVAVAMTALVAFICILVIRSHKSGIQTRNQELTENSLLITEQKAALKQKAEELEDANERLSAVNREKDEFLSIAAHDLRNPLSAIITLSHLIDQGGADANTKELLSLIQDSSESMLELIDELLNVARIESFHGKIDKQPVVWNELLDQVCRQFKHQADVKQIALVCDHSKTTGVVVQGVNEWMTSIVTNLVSNAIKFSPAHREVGIQTDLADGHIETRIRDMGPGFSSEDKSNLFKKFSRLSAKPTGKEHSTGLGLYAVKKMCDRLGIEIRIESELGKGTCFVLRTPVSETPNFKEE